MFLAKNVEFLRTQKGLSQEELGVLVGKSQASIFKVESGQITRPRYIRSLATVLGVSVHELEEEDLSGTFSRDSTFKQIEQKKQIGNRLVEQRVMFGFYSQEEFAKAFDYSLDLIKKIEFGEIDITLDLIIKISQSKLDLNYILSGNRTQTIKQTEGNSTVTTINGEGNIVGNNNSYQK